MFKGGYKLIDFKENNIVLATPTTIKGVYDAITNNDVVTITENAIKVS